MIKNLLFDMGGVIFRQNTTEAFRRFRELGIDPEYYMGAYGQKDFFLDLEMGKIGVDEFCIRVAEVSHKKQVSFAEAQYCWLGFIQDVPTERLHNLLKLKEKYHVGLLSNTNPFVMDFTLSQSFSSDARPISDYFHSMFLSYELQVCKPSPEIFRRALLLDGMKAEETVFIDDSPQNIEVAKNLNFKVLYVDSNEDWMGGLSLTLD